MIVRRGVLTTSGALVATLSGLALTFAVMLVTATPASAHAHLVKIDPADKAAIRNPLTKVTLTFDENMRAPAAIVVTAPTGARVDKGAAQVLDKTASARVQVVTPGRYTIAYRVVSADGHPVTGQTTFTYQPVGSPTPSAAVSSSPAGGGAAARNPADPHANHEEQGGTGSGWVIGGVAGLALLGGFALLIVRRRALGSAPAATGRDPA